MQACPTGWWKPTGFLLELMSAMNEIGPECDKILVTGGNGPGKTLFVINAIYIPLLHPFGAQLNPYVARWPFIQKKNRWCRYNGFINPGTHHAGLVMPTTAIELTFLPKLAQWAPRGSYETSNIGTTQKRRVIFHGGGAVSIFSPKQTLEEQAGGDIDFFVTSEPFPIRMIGEMNERLREKGFMFSENCPVYNQDAARIIQRYSLMDKGKVIMRQMHKATSCYEHAFNGFKRHENVKKGIDTLKAIDPAAVPARVAGISQHYAGKVFPQFSRSMHTKPEEWIIERLCDKGASFYCGIDAHDRYPYAALYMAVDSERQAYLVDEWPRWQKGIHFVEGKDWFENAIAPCFQPFHMLKVDYADDYTKICRVLHAVENDMLLRYSGGYQSNGAAVNSRINPRVIQHFMDPRSASKRKRTGAGQTSAIAEMRKAGRQYRMDFQKSAQEGYLEWRHRVIRGLLSDEEVYTEEEIRAGKTVNLTGLIVSERCQNFIYAIEEISHLPVTKYGAKVDDTGDEVQDSKIDPELKHFIDCLGYILQRNPGYIAPPELIDSNEERIERMMLANMPDGPPLPSQSGEPKFVCF